MRTAGSPACARSSCRCDSTRSSRSWSAKPELSGYVGEERLGNLGRDLGRELAAGEQTPLWDALEPELVEVREGGLADPVDAVIYVMRTAGAQGAETSRFLAGVYRGSAAPAFVVGVEPTRVEQAQSLCSSATSSRPSTASTRSARWRRCSSSPTRTRPATTACA